MSQPGPSLTWPAPRPGTVEAEIQEWLESTIWLPTSVATRRRDWAAALALHLGLRGRDPLPTAEAAALMGVTSSRANAFRSKALRRLAASPAALPTVRSALALARATVPCRPGELSSALRAAGLTDLDWSPLALTALARVVGEPLVLAERAGVATLEQPHPPFRRIRVTTEDGQVIREGRR